MKNYMVAAPKMSVDRDKFNIFNKLKQISFHFLIYVYVLPLTRSRRLTMR